MTHTRKKASTRPAPSSERRDNSSQGPYGDNMDVAWPQRLLRFGRTKKIGQVISHRKDEAKRVTGTGKRRKKSDAVRKTHRKQREKKRDRKSYPLRGRTTSSDEEGLNCHVLLTRVDDGLAEQEGSDAEAMAQNNGHKKLSHKSKSRKDKRGRRKETKVTPKTKSRSNTQREEDVVYLPEPRKRRLASLNAEAVNSLLLDRGSDQHPPAKQAKRQHEEPANERAPLVANPAWSGAAGGINSPQISTTKATALLKPEPGQGSKRSKKKAKANRGDLRGCVSQASLDAPAPRRLAGLTAAALLKLTSTSATSKQRVKAVPTATVTTDPKAPVLATTLKPQTRVKLKAKGRSQKTRGKKGAPPTDEDATAATACKDKADFEPKVEWENSGCNHKLAEAGYPQRGMLGFQLKSVKEEQEETDLSPYYCCPPEGSVEYCHRLAFFLGQQAYGDPEGQPHNPALTPVKRECLVGSPTLTHAHPHAALTLSPHPCLCTAEHCFSSYYVHIAHPTHTGTPSAALAARPLNFAPSSLCPNRVGRSKLLGPRVGHAAGLAHPACCGPVGSPCYNEACRISGYAYRAMPPVASRGCSFSTGCTGCQHSIKTEGYSPSQGLAPSLPLSSLPLPSTPPPTQPKPHLPTLLPGRDQPPARLKLAKECPQATAKSSSVSASPDSSGRTRLTQKQAPPPAPGLVGARQKVSRRRATNGWRPVGGPVEREVFIAGDEETALRQCYDGVERDGEVVRVRDTVLLRSGPRKKSLPYVAKISALWEDPKTGELMMSLFWYYRPEHTQGGRDPSAHCEKEIFASRHQDENSVACIEDRCYVLPLAQYCRFCALLKRRAEGVAPGGPGSGIVVPCCADFAPPSHRCVPSDVDPQLVYLCRHVYDFRYGRILKNLQ